VKLWAVASVDTNKEKNSVAVFVSFITEN